jgi:ATP-dependent RNA helicase DHX29
MRIQGVTDSSSLPTVEPNRLPQLISGLAFIDRKIKFRIPGRTNVALKYLRYRLATILANQIRGKPLSESHLLWNELAMSVLGKTKLITSAEEGQGGIGQIVIV